MAGDSLASANLFEFRTVRRPAPLEHCALGELPVTPFKAAATPPQQETPGLGLGLAPAATIEGPGGTGVIVTEVDPDGRAAERGNRGWGHHSRYLRKRGQNIG